jgi:DNA-binding MarR family transcriptional regulator
MVQRAAKTVHPQLQPAGLHLLRMLERCGPVRPSEAAERLDVDRSAISRLITSLDALGLIQRTDDPHDKRAYMLALTDEGRSRLSRLASSEDGPLRLILRQWEPEDIESFARLLARLNSDAASHGFGA